MTGTSARPGASRPRRTKRRRKQHGLAFKIITRTLMGLLGLFVLGCIALFVIYQRTTIPQPNADAQKQSSILYYDDGKTELARFNNTTREDVPIGKIPDHVQKAFLAAEDRNFYENRGISPTGIARAFWTNLRGGSTQGGSTITQQYVKNYFLSQDRTLTRKFKEVMISLKVDNKMSKDQILDDYLNTIYFGRNAYGIQAASKAYFNKDVSQLTVSEGAFLASVVNSPSRMDPAAGKSAAALANSRMVYVLNGMVTEGWLSQAERDKQRMPTFQPRKRQSVPGPTGYVRDLVESELKGKLGLSQQDIDRGGLRITTTINKQAEDAAVAAVEQRLPQEESTKNLHVGLAAQKPGDGAVVAVYGGRDPAVEANNATYQRMQGASSFKVFGLIGALQDGMTLRTTYSGRSPMYFKEYRSATNPTGKVSNFANESYGQITLQKALANSVNTVFLQVNHDIGPKKTASVAEAAGIPSSDFAPGDRTSLANILGTPSVHVMDMATAFNTVNAQGQKASPYYIKKVTSVVGDYSYQANPKPTRVFDKDITLNVTAAMQDVIKEGSGTAARSLGRPAAGKTGTSNANMSVWFSGFTPQLTASVGIFQSADGGKTTQPMQNIAGIPNLTGGTFPTEIWTAFMEGALKGQKVEQFPKAPALNGSYSPSTTQTSTPTMAPTTPSTSATSSAPSTTSSSSTATSSSSTSTPPPPTTSTAPPTQAPTTTQPPTRTAPPTRTSAPQPPKPTLTPAGGVAPSTEVRPSAITTR